MSRPTLHSPEVVALLEEVVALVGTAMRVPGARGLEVQWWDDPEDGAGVDISVRDACGCTHTLTRFLDLGSEKMSPPVKCLKHSPKKAPEPWPEGVPW